MYLLVLLVLSRYSSLLKICNFPRLWYIGFLLYISRQNVLYRGILSGKRDIVCCMSFYHLQDSCVGRVCANMILKSHYGHTHTDVSNLTSNIEVPILKSNKERDEWRRQLWVGSPPSLLWNIWSSCASEEWEESCWVSRQRESVSPCSHVEKYTASQKILWLRAELHFSWLLIRY